MTARALPAGPPRRKRALFGLLDADGWGWASVKAFFWFIVIIFLLGYVPDRAYYFTVSRTLDLGILAWSPVNLCPPENETLPCPAPPGSVIPWEPSPQQVALPAARTDAAFVQAGTRVLLIGGTDGQAASDTTFVARTSGVGNFDSWTAGPTLPAPRRDAAVAFFNGLIYVVGGYDADNQPTDTTFVLTPNLQTGELGEWQTAEELDEPIDLPEARAAAPLIALADGLLLPGGVGPDGQPTRTVWKTTVDDAGKLGEWIPQAELAEVSADAVGVLNGEFAWLLGGRDANGPTTRVQRGSVVTPAAGDGVGEGVEPDEAGASASPSASADPSASVAPTVPEDASRVPEWSASAGAALPGARVDASGFATNGTVYVIGGSDGSTSQNELYWATPATGSGGDTIGEWKHLAVSDLPEPGLQGAAVGQLGPNLVLVGGRSGDAVQVGSVRANLAPEAPFFQLGLVGAVVPALQIEGEIGQQLGYLNAAGAGGTMFAILIVIGYLYAHKEQTARWWGRIRRR